MNAFSISLLYNSKLERLFLAPLNRRLNYFATPLNPELKCWDRREENWSRSGNIDDELSDIAKVTSHRFKGAEKSLSNLELQLVWDDDPNPNWYPWNSTFRSSELIHEYFEKNQMRKIYSTKIYLGSRSSWLHFSEKTKKTKWINNPKSRKDNIFFILNNKIPRILSSSRGSVV